MKEKIHPTYYPDAKVSCASCGTTWTTGSTRKELRVDVCSNCHPFFTGEQARLLDTEGQVDRFYRKVKAAQSHVEEKKARENAKLERPISELELSDRATNALIKIGIKNVPQFLAKLAEGEEAMLAIAGFGRKPLVDAKKKLKALGFELPVSVVPETA
ncbi:MAG: 50S ribosomal protein L31 [Chloroflexi bacterium RIFOXYC12_FULL_59_14]|nr:MAG: 50S ribosomal protein L31 [Anaerolinea sp. RIFOXYB12_FULL_60_12]OGO76001.1 MAG: 50S ribosomal protein L31 [Chloroflexi bacterium RIFOXYC12_FULL_59_14]